MHMSFEAELQSALAALPHDMPGEACSLFKVFYDLLSRWNAHHNLTRITDPQAFIDKHLIDSLLLTHCIAEKSTVIDIGSGAGFPGIPLAIAFPDAEIILVESQKKKVAFLETATRALSLGNVSIWDCHLSAHTILSFFEKKPHREPIYLVSRATFSLPNLVGLGLPLLKRAATLIAMKGPEYEDELSSLADMDVRVHGPFTLPFSQSKRFLIKIQTAV